MTSKGVRAEEALRAYFSELGYFVVRGMSVKVGAADVTDIDLWLYNRPSPVTRERINVDVKNKKTPKALERIFWAKGLQAVLGFDSCIVATTDKRSEVVEFGRAHDVTVMGGTVLQRICTKQTVWHIQDEDFRTWSNKYREGGAKNGWFERTTNNASTLGYKIGFDACNHLLPEIRYFLEQVQLDEDRLEEAVRYLYLNISYFLISLDFALSDSAFLSVEERQKQLDEGFRFGDAGEKGTKQITEIAVRLSSAITGAGLGTVRDSLQRAFREVDVAILSEYFSKTHINNALYSIAREFNRLAFQEDVTAPIDLESRERNVLYVLLDHFEIERAAFMSKMYTEKQSAGCSLSEGTDRNELNSIDAQHELDMTRDPS